MKAIYKPKGRAAEYAPLAVNHYSGCTHGCTYCYAPLVLHKDRATFHASTHPRKDILKKIEADAQEVRHMRDQLGKPLPVFLCFTCDPYQPAEESHELTRKAIKILHAADVPVKILSKGGLRMTRDFHILRSSDWVGASLTFTSDVDSKEWEPNAAPPHERIGALWMAKKYGLRTWASLEPVIDPKQTLDLIIATHEYVDLYKVGAFNYHPAAKLIDWRKFHRDVTELLIKYRKSYVLKTDLLKAAGLPCN